MSNTISCPSCKTEIEITEAIESRLNQKLRQQFESEFRKKEQSLTERQQLIDKQVAKLSTDRQQLEAELQKRVQEAQADLLATAKKEAAEALDLELKDRDQQLASLKSDLKKANSAELELRKQKRELEDKTESLELEITRRLDAERDKIQDAASKKAAEEFRLKEKESEKKISDMKAQIDDLKRKAEQGSVQTQGEVLELDLESMLEDAFPHDSIEPVAKGVNGADAQQIVRSPSGSACGSILWESKRTKNFQKSWLPKLRDDQRCAKATVAVLVTEALPDDIDTFALVEGVWICSRQCARALASALRIGIIETAKSKLAAEGRTEKTGLVYSYVSGSEFRQCVEGMVESVIAMQSDLDSEKRSIKRQWNKREKQIERAITNMAVMYGNLQGIVGGSMPTVEGLATPLIECESESQSSSISAA